MFTRLLSFGKFSYYLPSLLFLIVAAKNKSRDFEFTIRQSSGNLVGHLRKISTLWELFEFQESVEAQSPRILLILSINQQFFPKNENLTKITSNNDPSDSMTLLLQKSSTKFALIATVKSTFFKFRM